jgi:hypothetical protein
MGLNPELVETIKGHFATKPSTELRAILEARDTATMSDEFFAAAEAVLAERQRGDATEPVPGSTEPPGPPDTRPRTRVGSRLDTARVRAPRGRLW